MKLIEILSRNSRGRKSLRAVLAALLLVQGVAIQAQTPSSHQHPATNAPADLTSLQTQLGQLRNQIGELARIIQSPGGSQMPAAPNPAMPGMPNMSAGTAAGGGMSMGDMGMKRMGMMEMDKMMMGMSGMKSGGTAGLPGMSGPGPNMGMDTMMKGMDMMGMISGMPGMNMPSALPGFPGASHLYHIGATGFFLDHPEHITLSTEQETSLNKIKEQAALAKNTSDREVADAEQELWQLTSSDQPDAAKIEAKIREIEKQRADARLAFIRSVGEAAKTLTDEQRKLLIGQMPAHGQKGSAAHQHKP